MTATYKKEFDSLISDFKAEAVVKSRRKSIPIRSITKGDTTPGYIIKIGVGVIRAVNYEPISVSLSKYHHLSSGSSNQTPTISIPISKKKTVSLSPKKAKKVNKIEENLVSKKYSPRKTLKNAEMSPKQDKPIRPTRKGSKLVETPIPLQSKNDRNAKELI